MMKIEKLVVPPAYKVVSQELEKLILGGTFSPGDQLPSEVELASLFGVNRSTLREGIRHLESEGLVSREGRKRLVITIPDHAELAPRATRSLLMSDVTFKELWEVARVLEPVSAGLAAQDATEQDLAHLARNIEQMALLIENGKPTGDVDLVFHSLLAETTGNRVLLQAREPIGQLLYPPFDLIQLQIPQAPMRNLRAHREIHASLVTRDSERATQWMGRHLEDLKRGWLLAGRSMTDPISQPLPAN